MKRLLAIFICLALLLVSCTPQTNDQTTNISNENSGESSVDIQPTIPNPEIEFTGLEDPALLQYVEDDVYSKIVDELDSDSYFVENISAVYLSKEYLDEVAYNSQANIYFGYSLAELEDQFQGTKFVFTLGDDGQTTVKEFEAYDDTYEKVIRNVAIGTGVILLCVTVSVVTGGVAAPAAVSVVFAVSAKSAAVCALSGSVISGAATGIVTGIQTKDFDKSLKAAALAGSEGFMWGAITGAIAGGATEAIALRGATLNGLTMNQAAQIQKESKYPLDIIKQFKSVEEYQVYKNAGLTTKMINRRLALGRKIDLKYVSEIAGKKVTNLERMKLGYAPIEPETGKAYQLHHIGQKSDATLAVLTEKEHQSNSIILNVVGKESEINRIEFKSVREQFWKSFAASVS